MELGAGRVEGAARQLTRARRRVDRGSGLLCNIGTGVETSVNELYAAMAAAAGVAA